jgi:hypothetical protein
MREDPMTRRSEVRTSRTHPLYIDWLDPPFPIGMTLALGVHDDSTYGFRWERDLNADLGELRRLGATALACLLDDHEFGRYDIEHLVPMARALGLEVLRLPVPDGLLPELSGGGQPGPILSASMRVGLPVVTTRTRSRSSRLLARSHPEEAHMFLRSLVTLGAVLLCAPAFARAGGGFAPIPPEQTHGQKTGLEIRVVGYDGSVNGEIAVDVRNPGQRPVEFAARGLYFVPNGNPDEAPQRLGAVGPFRVQTADGWQPRERLTIAAGATQHLKLDVYCIDSHRGSPSSATSFRMGKDRIPKPLVEAIERDTRKEAEKLGGVSDPRAKGAVQSQIWKDRDAKWIELDGEGKQEAAKKK